MDMQGPKGDKGDQGSRGWKGEKGDPGERGSMGFEGETGPQGIQGEKGDKGDTGARGAMGFEGNPGKDSTVPGPKGEKGSPGKDGIDGKDADTTEIKTLALDVLQKHESSFDHTLLQPEKLDPFLVGSKKIDESTIGDKKVLQYNAQAGKIVYATLPTASNNKHSGGIHGILLPKLAGNSGKFLTVDGGETTISWATVAGGGTGITRTITSVAVNTTAAAAASTDYVYLCSGTMNLTMPTASSNLNRYSIKNSGVGTVTVLFTGGQNADGSTSLSLTPNTSIDLISNSSNWFVI